MENEKAQASWFAETTEATRGDIGLLPAFLRMFPSCACGGFCCSKLFRHRNGGRCDENHQLHSQRGLCAIRQRMIYLYSYELDP